MSLLSTIKSAYNTVKKTVSKLPVQTASVNKALTPNMSIAPKTTKPTFTPITQVGNTFVPSSSLKQSIAPNMSMPSSPSGVGYNGVALTNTGRITGTTSSKSGSSSKKPPVQSSTLNAFLASGASSSGSSSGGSSGASSGGSTSGGINFGTSTPNTNVVNTVNNQNLKNATDLTLPQKDITQTDAIIPPTVDTQIADAQKQQKEDFQSYLDALDKQKQPSEAKLYQKAQRETDILNKQKLVNDLTGQLNAVVNRGEANKLALVGQGRGIPEVIIGGQQAEIARETAIQALPIQAQLSAAQGDLQSAEANLNTLFKIYTDDATNQYNYEKAKIEAVWNFADSQDKAKLADLQKQKDREYEKTQADIKAKQDLAIEATKGGASATAISSIANATDFASALKSASPYIQSTQVVKLDNGQTVIIDGQGKIIRNLGGAKASTGTDFIITKDTLKNTYGNDIVSTISNVIKSSGAKQSQSTNDAINVISGLQQLVTDNPSGKFTGLAPIRLTPGKFKSTESLTNLSDIEAINLKVQQWASGAALTNQQTKQVEKITPQKGDTDKQVRSKVNALANYMVSQVSGQLAGQGVGFAMDKVDLFEKTPIQELSQLYKDPVMKQKIQEAVQLYPSYTDAEILQIVKP